MKTLTKYSTTVLNRWTRVLGTMLTLALMAHAVAVSQPYSNPTTVNLGTAANYRILAAAGLTIDATCTVTGNVGGITVTHNGPVIGDLWGTTVTGSGTVSGTIHDNTDGAVSTANTALSNAISTAAALTFSGTTGASLAAVELGGVTLGRGIYVGPGTLGINGTLTLTGTATDIFIIRTGTPGTTLITGTGCVVTMGGTALASNVFWIVGSSATTVGDFKGNILAYTNVTQTSGTLNGRALARDGFVTLSGTSALPVELVSFTAAARSMNADLRWSTATEINNYGFEIERRQTASWAKVGFVSGAGTSNAPRDYSYTDNNLSAGRYTYRLKQVDNNGAFSYHGSVEVAIGLAPQEFALSQNYPNPFNPSTMIQYSLANAAQVSLKVYNVLGLEVATLVSGRQEAGSYTVPFSAIGASTFASGVYFYRLEAGSFVSTKKLVLMK
jgi:Ice-binding-like/Secretion system C-terminal sorting domain